MSENPTPRKSTTVVDLDQQRLAHLTPKQVDLVKRVLEHHPQLTVAEALRALNEAGM